MSTTITDATQVEIDHHRWYATVRITRPDGTQLETFICADAEHSGLWVGHPDDHEEH